ncbi:hypothetical protein C5Y93_19720 [Blastopirellula marina]|uniref:Uncharacterized protein n=1 Tax=Blastopirellula marina TaxID=124 RepID=A0A2S8GIE0_9BACT|nr:hypothetical protein C5Y93_19720 [Blastopirellula marina]
MSKHRDEWCAKWVQGHPNYSGGSQHMAIYLRRLAEREYKRLFPNPPDDDEEFALLSMDALCELFDCNDARTARDWAAKSGGCESDIGPKFWKLPLKTVQALRAGKNS